MEISNLLSDRVKSLKASAIREIFKMVGKSDIISFAGGIPSPELFPANELGKIADKILENNGAKALIYGITEGYAPLIEIVEKRNKEKNIGKSFDSTIITTGAQQAIDLVGKAILNEQDGVIVEAPSFIGALNSFRSYNARLFEAEVKEDGIDLNQVENLLKTEKNIKLIYTITTFQNPTGITLSLDKRKKLLELAKKYDCLILEDNPYGELRFNGEEVASIKSFDTEGRVIYVGSFSKTLSPGIRVGFLTCHKDIMDRVVVVKQVNDVHTPLLNQMMVTEYISNYDFDEHIRKSAVKCGEKCAAMLEGAKKYFPGDVKLTNPDGGIFLWCTMPEGIDTGAIFEKAVENKVAFVPGRTCMADIDKVSNCFRLNYTTVSNEKIDEGMKILGRILQDYV